MPTTQRSQPVIVTGWTPDIPRELRQLLIDAVKYDQLADTVDGSQRKRYFRRKTQAMVRAHTRYSDWFYPPYREGTCVALIPKTGWPSETGIRTRMHIPIGTIVANSYYRKRYQAVIEAPSRRRKPQCASGAKRWPRRLCPRMPRRRRQRYRNRRLAMAAAPA